MKKLVLLLFLIAGTILCSESFYANDYYCRLAVRENGDIQIRETIQYRFNDQSITSVERIIPAKFTDGLEFIRALLKTPDGEIVSESKEFKNSAKALKVVWKFEEFQDSLLNFELEFIAKKACFEENKLQYIRWQSIPEDHPFQIKIGSVEMLLPRKTEPIIFLDPMNEGISTGYRGNQIWWNLKELKPKDNFVSGIAILEGTFPFEEPQWYLRQIKAAEYIKYYTQLSMIFAVLIFILFGYAAFNLWKSSRKSRYTEIREEIYDIHPVQLIHLVKGFSVNIKVIKTLILSMIIDKHLSIEDRDGSFYLQMAESTSRGSNLEFIQFMKDIGIAPKMEFGEMIGILKGHKSFLNGYLLESQIASGFTDIFRYKKQKIDIAQFIVFVVLLIGSVVFSLYMIDHGLLWGLFVSFGLAFITLYAGFRLIASSVFTEKGLSMKYALKKTGKLLRKEIFTKAQILDKDDFEKLLMSSMITGNAGRLIRYFKNIEGSNDLEYKLRKTEFSMELLKELL